MINVVRLLRNRARAWCRLYSVAASSAEVASSRITTLGSASTIRAMARRWRCPPDKRTPERPTMLSRPLGKSRTVLCSWAISSACQQASSLRSRPMVRLARMVSLNSAGCCRTTATFSRTVSRPISCWVEPPKRMVPAKGVYRPSRSCTNVLLPPPLAPTIATFSPGAMERFIWLSTSSSP
ncbi:hypothetical protein D3C80_1411480 [compost metagenome]